jgi:hypothetical protein
MIGTKVFASLSGWVRCGDVMSVKWGLGFGMAMAISAISCAFGFGWLTYYLL